MIDGNRLIDKLQKRIDAFVKQHPKRKNCVEIEIIKEFIHMIELEMAETDNE